MYGRETASFSRTEGTGSLLMFSEIPDFPFLVLLTDAAIRHLLLRMVPRRMFLPLHHSLDGCES